MSRLLVPLLVLVPVLAPAAPIPRDALKPGPYFPTKVGAKWVYQNGDGKHERTEVIMNVEDKDGAKLVTVGYESQGKATADSVLSISEKGICCVDTAVSTLDEPFWLLKLPHAANKKWDVVLAPTVLSPLKGTATAVGPEKVEVPAGKFEAIRVTLVMHDYEDGDLRITSWYAPNIGVIKEVRKEGKNESSKVLKSFTPGKD